MSISKTRLMSYSQCARQLWLQQYSPELEAESAETERRFATGRVVGETARRVYGRAGGHHVKGDRGLRAAIAATTDLIEAGGNDPVFEATFEYDAVVVSVDVLLRDGDGLGIVEVKSSTSVRDHHLLDCAIQAWTLEQLGHRVDRVAVAHIDSGFVYDGGNSYTGLFAEQDVRERIEPWKSRIPAMVEQTRATLALLDEPEIDIGDHCRSPYPCPFFKHCAPQQGEYPVAALGGKRDLIDRWLRAGIEDLRDVPEHELVSDRQRMIFAQTRAGRPHIGAALGERLRALPAPRYFVDFETIAFAVPVWPETRPYEALPFQWSCHIDDGGGRPRHEEFLDLSGAAPMRAAAESLIEALGDSGPIIVYSGYERRVLDALGRRYPDLAPALDALGERLFDLLPPLKRHFYDPGMLGSWSIKAVLPVVAPELDYSALGEVSDGDAAQSAYLAAIDADTTTERRAAIGRALREYCRLDTLAMLRLVEYFSRA